MKLPGATRRWLVTAIPTATVYGNSENALILVAETRVELDEDVVFSAVLTVAVPAGLFAEGLGGGFLLAGFAGEVVIGSAFGDRVSAIHRDFDTGEFAIELALLG